MKTCGLCHQPITSCPECGGLLCTPGCKDRSEDGCLCDAQVAGDADEPSDLDA